jgi:hypothetical protein
MTADPPPTVAPAMSSTAAAVGRARLDSAGSAPVVVLPEDWSDRCGRWVLTRPSYRMGAARGAGGGG